VTAEEVRDAIRHETDPIQLMLEQVREMQDQQHAMQRRQYEILEKVIGSNPLPELSIDSLVSQPLCLAFTSLDAIPAECRPSCNSSLCG
jgi:proline dehydrogenase